MYFCVFSVPQCNNVVLTAVFPTFLSGQAAPFNTASGASSLRAAAVSCGGIAYRPKLAKLDTSDLLETRPGTILAARPDLSSAERVQDEHRKWDVHWSLLSDVEWLVSLCNSFAPPGTKSWDEEVLGKSSRAQAYNRHYRGKKERAIESVRAALGQVLEQNRSGGYQPELAILTDMRGADFRLCKPSRPRSMWRLKSGIPCPRRCNGSLTRWLRPAPVLT